MIIVGAADRRARAAVAAGVQPEQAMRGALKGFESGDWEQQFAALDVTRRLALNHSGVLGRQLHPVVMEQVTHARACHQDALFESHSRAMRVRLTSQSSKVP